MPRAPRDKRKKRPQPIRLTERDYNILELVYACRVVTTTQVQQLFFPSLHRTYNRLNRLYHHGLLDRKFIGVGAARMNNPIMYVLDRRGAETLIKQGYDIQWSSKHKRVKPMFLEHTLALSTLRVFVTKACQDKGYELLEWLGESELKASYDRVKIKGVAGSTAVIPDSYCAIKTTQGIVHLFWELDRGTMPGKRFKRKIEAYQEYAKSELVKKRFGAHRFRVATVTESSRRATNLKAITEKVGGKSRFWFASLQELSPDTILSNSIWQVAGRAGKSALLQE